MKEKYKDLIKLSFANLSIIYTHVWSILYLY